MGKVKEQFIVIQYHGVKIYHWFYIMTNIYIGRNNDVRMLFYIMLFDKLEVVVFYKVIWLS